MLSQLPAVSLRFEFALRRGFVIRPRELPFYLLFCARWFSVDVFSFSKQFLLFYVRLVVRSIILSLPLKFVDLRSTIFLFEPARSYNWISFLFLAVSFVARVAPFIPCTSSRPSSTDILWFSPRFTLSFDWLSSVPRSSSRPSPTSILLLCAAVPFVSWMTSFRSTRSSSRLSPAGIVLFCAAVTFVFRLTLFLFHAVVPGLLPRASCYPQQQFLLHSRPHSFVSRDIFLCVYLLFRAPFRFISPLTFFCLDRSLPFVVDLLQTIGCEWSGTSAFCLANIFNCISRPSSGFAYAVQLFFALKMAFWSRFTGKCRLSGPRWVSVSAMQSWKVIIHASRSPQLQCKTTETQETSGEHTRVANGNCFPQLNWAKISAR